MELTIPGSDGAFGVRLRRGQAETGARFLSANNDKPAVGAIGVTHNHPRVNA